MPSFVNPLINNATAIDEFSFIEHGIDIIDYETVGYDKNTSGAKRSLTLNIYKYEKVLEPEKSMDCPAEEKLLMEELIECKNEHQLDKKVDYDKKFKNYDKKDSKRILLMLPLIILFLVTCVSTLGFITHKVLENHNKGLQ